ncbi:hypothetical protein GCM10023197_35620 [Gordonia humi]|uniref:Ribbon-helix-helix protein CopG domain-containing protein n=3 Tax=Gordonia humi TaxID=686429 RepID=A0A840FAQ5_9ACTN|nr:hypothetical protein [Gordonia humi]
MTDDPALDALADDFERGDFDIAPETTELTPASHSLPMGRPTRPRGSSPLRAVRLPRALDDQLTSYANRRGESTSAVVRAAISEYLDRHSA